MRASTCVLALLSLLFAAPSGADQAADRRALERGRYLVIVGGCNDCHTPAYPEKAGKVSETDWLTGSAVGFRGPWGTTYPANLRLLARSISENQWITRARSPMRPPMPWFNLRDMTDGDLRAMYRFIRSLGPGGVSAPAYVSPGQPVATPYIDFAPKNLASAQAEK